MFNLPANGSHGVIAGHGSNSDRALMLKHECKTSQSKSVKGKAVDYLDA